MSRNGVFVLIVLMLSTFGFQQVQAATEEARHALVIGNASYTWSPLNNPVNDAQDMAKSLRRLGFEVTILIDADLRQMRRAAIDFGRVLGKSGGVGLFYYAGHGMQVDGENYLIPLEAEIEVEDHVPVEAMSVNQILARMGGAKNRMNIVILDACRNNPVGGSVRSVSRGLAQTDAPFGTYISFATAPGQVAADGSGRNGLYTGALLEALEEPGIKIEETFKAVRSKVVASTDGRQVPWSSSSIVGDFAFNEETDLVELEFGDEPTAESNASGEGIDIREQSLWQAVSKGATATDYRTYLKLYPEGVYAPLATARLADLEAAQNRSLALEKAEKDEFAALREELNALKEREAASEQIIADEMKIIEELKRELEERPGPPPEEGKKRHPIPPAKGEQRLASGGPISSLAAVPDSRERVILADMLGTLVFAEMHVFQGSKLVENKFAQTIWSTKNAYLRSTYFDLTVSADSNADVLNVQGRSGKRLKYTTGKLERTGPNTFEGKLYRRKLGQSESWRMTIKILKSPNT